MALEPEENAFTAQTAASLLKNIYPQYRVLTRDWAYPFMPVFVQKATRKIEAQASATLNNCVAQSLWIEFYKSFDGSFDAKIDNPR